MATTWAATNRKPVIVDVLPPTVSRALGPQAGTFSGSGSWRGVRCTLTASGTYTTGGDSLPSAASLGLQRIETVLVVGTGTPAGNGQQFRFNTSTSKVMLYGATNVELTAATATTGAYDVIILGR